MGVSLRCLAETARQQLWAFHGAVKTGSFNFSSSLPSPHQPSYATLILFLITTYR